MQNNSIHLAHELLEWFNCPKRALQIYKEGCSTSSQASYIRQHVRIIHAFLDTYETPNHTYKVDSPSLAESITHSHDIIAQHTHTHITHATIASNNLAIFIPYMYWHKHMNGWVMFIPTSSSGVQKHHLQLTTFITIVCKNLSIPIAKILLSHYHHQIHNSVDWINSDISTKAQKYYDKEHNSFTQLFSLIKEDTIDTTLWTGCNKQYCEVCSVEDTYKIDDIRTLRKAKILKEELVEKSISKITDIPHELFPNSMVTSRQVNSVFQDKPTYIHDEVYPFLEKLAYPRYYLDFEAFSTPIPYNYGAPYIAKPGSFTPFLFSLQHQKEAQGAVHTQLWSMMPGKNQIKQLWEALKPELLKAGSIIVYDSQFEHDMIQQLATSLSENQKGDSILQKIVDLQEIFFNLAVYHPAQKGKISLKTITKIWTTVDYSSLKINEGISANYHFTALTDKALGIFDNIQQHPYVHSLFEHIANIEKDITLQDIATYCKYDTEVMIRIVNILEYWAEHYTKDEYIYE